MKTDIKMIFIIVMKLMIKIKNNEQSYEKVVKPGPLPGGAPITTDGPIGYPL